MSDTLQTATHLDRTNLPSPDELHALLSVQPEKYTWHYLDMYHTPNFPQDETIRNHLRDLVGLIAYGLMDPFPAKYIYDDNYFPSDFEPFIDRMLHGTKDDAAYFQDIHVRIYTLDQFKFIDVACFPGDDECGTGAIIHDGLIAEICDLCDNDFCYSLSMIETDPVLCTDYEPDLYGYCQRRWPSD